MEIVVSISNRRNLPNLFAILNSHIFAILNTRFFAILLEKSLNVSHADKIIAPDKAAYCVFTQFRERENAIKFISVRTKTQ